LISGKHHFFSYSGKKKNSEIVRPKLAFSRMIGLSTGLCNGTKLRPNVAARMMLSDISGGCGTLERSDGEHSPLGSFFREAKATNDSAFRIRSFSFLYFELENDIDSIRDQDCLVAHDFRASG
jgi:hypothetical protein